MHMNLQCKPTMNYIKVEDKSEAVCQGVNFPKHVIYFVYKMVIDEIAVIFYSYTKLCCEGRRGI